MERDEGSSSSFPMGETAHVHVVDLAGLTNPSERSNTIKDIRNACRTAGCFQMINHGIAQLVLDEALETAFDFFNLPTEEKEKFMSNDVYKPVRYNTSLKDGADKLQFWRVFLKHYAHPLNQWIDQWPNNPPGYREKMGKFAVEVKKLAVELMGAITESLGLGPTYITQKMEDGAQVMVINCYPPCPQPNLPLGLPPHSDYSCFTILLRSGEGLETRNDDGAWNSVSILHGALIVVVGDHLEVLSNGIYKSIVHRVTVNREETRISIACLHSLGIDEKMETAEELVDEEHPRGYKASSFMDFLDFLANNDIAEKSFLHTLKLKD